MRTFVRSTLTLAAALGFVAAAAAPAVAGPLGTCPHGEPTCVYIPAGSYPIGNPVVTGPLGQPMSYVELPQVCDPSGTDCIRTFLIVPGFSAQSSGGTVATVNFPGFGIGVSSTGLVTIYVSPPTVTPGGTGLGITLSVSEDDFVVGSNQITRECDPSGPTTVGPVTTQTTACVTTVTLSV